MNDHAGNSLETDPHYYSYMMRLLRTQNGQSQVWRVSLEEPLTEQMHRFDNLHSLFAFLLARTGQDWRIGDGGDCSPSPTGAQSPEHTSGLPNANTNTDSDYSRQGAKRQTDIGGVE